MKQYIRARIIEVADYIIATRCTVRQAGKKFCLSKSTVHKDMQQRLPEVDREKWQTVNNVLENNLSQRHLRGGIATKRKYQKQRMLNTSV